MLMSEHESTGQVDLINPNARGQGCKIISGFQDIKLVFFCASRTWSG